MTGWIRHEGDKSWTLIKVKKMKNYFIPTTIIWIIMFINLLGLARSIQGGKSSDIVIGSIAFFSAILVILCRYLGDK